MKNTKKIMLCTLITAAFAFPSINGLKAQTDTVKVIEKQTVVHDTVVRPEPPVIRTETTVVRTEPQRTAPPLRRGELGFRFMPIVTSLALNTYNGETVQGEATLSYGYGVMLGLNLSKNIGLQAEVSYNDIFQKYKDRNLDREIHVSYINIPLMLSLNTDKTKPVNLNVVVGPQLGINAGSSTNTSSNGNTDTLHAVLAVRQSDIGLAYGAGLEFALNRQHTFRFDIGFRGVYGLVNIDAATSENNTYNILVHASRKSYGGYAGLTLLF